MRQTKVRRKAAKAAMLTATCGMLFTSACGGSGAGSSSWKYPDYADTVLTEGEDSWDKWKEECPEGITINWYVDSYINVNQQSIVTKAIKAKTGITVNFDTQVGDGTDKLSLMIGSDTLPDVITVEAGDERMMSMQAEGYIFPLDGLAEKWAPSLLGRIQEDIVSAYSGLDGRLYGLPSYAFTSEDLASGEKLQTNGGMLIRKDWYEAYMVYYCDLPEAERSGKNITTPDGLLYAMDWVRDNVLDSEQKGRYTGFLLDPFVTSKGNQGIAWLCQYFAVPFEDAEGNYIDGRETEQYMQVLKFLNQCYRQGFLTESAISATTTDEVGKVIANGNAFVLSVTPQNYSQYFNSAKFPGAGSEEGAVEYVSFVMRNEDGETPVLGDIGGTGYTMSMITKNASRPDLIVKLFDFLYSDEGQKLVAFGIEGETDDNGNVIGVKDPVLAEVLTVDDVTYICDEEGMVTYTDNYLAWKAGNDSESQAKLNQLGLGEWTLFYRPTYQSRVLQSDAATAQDAYIANLKAPLTIYSSTYQITSRLLDVTSEEYSDMVKTRTKVESLWANAVMSIIKAPSWEEAQTIYKNGMKQLDNNGRKQLFEHYNTVYQRKKEGMDVVYGWKLNDPEYAEPEIQERYTFTYQGREYTDICGARGDVSYYKEYMIIE